jgi:hypothetical protein
MTIHPRTTTKGRRLLLLAVATLMCAAAALAIGILLFGDFDGTEGRILATTMLLAVHGALGVPAAILWDQRRLPVLAAAGAGLAAVAASLNILAVWWSGAGDGLGKTIATVMFFLVATAVTAALAARPLHRLFYPSVVLAVVAATMGAAGVWAETEREGYLRLLGAVVVLDVLLVALQPLLQRLGREQAARPLRIADTSGHTFDVTVRSDSLADAVAGAIRDVERQGGHVRSLEILERVGTSSNGSARGEPRSAGDESPGAEAGPDLTDA